MNVNGAGYDGIKHDAVDAQSHARPATLVDGAAWRNWGCGSRQIPRETPTPPPIDLSHLLDSAPCDVFSVIYSDSLGRPAQLPDAILPYTMLGTIVMSASRSKAAGLQTRRNRRPREERGILILTRPSVEGAPLL